MPSENTELPNTIKYSIWKTRTDEIQPGTKEKSAESTERPILESKTTDNRD
jgi:hypothetical protein